MNRKLVLKMLGYVLALEAGLLMLPLMVGLYYRERCVLSLLATSFCFWRQAFHYFA